MVAAMDKPVIAVVDDNEAGLRALRRS